jgi:hypothetical protein
MAVQMVGLDQTMAVYTADASTGAYTVLAASGVPCRLAHVHRGTATGPERAELAALRNLLWEPDTILSEHSQVEVDGDGVRYNVVAGTLEAYRGPSGELVYRRCDVIRAG